MGPKVIDAAFQVRDELAASARRSASRSSLDVADWQAEIGQWPSSRGRLTLSGQPSSRHRAMLAEWPVTNPAAKTCFREATALVERIELRITSPVAAPRDREDHVVAGFRANGAASFFFGDDPVYQFNSVGQLRRGYCGGLLFKATRGQLVLLQRVRRLNETQLLSRHLTDSEQLSFTGEMQTRLREFGRRLQNSCFEVIGEVPAERGRFRPRPKLAGDARRIARRREATRGRRYFTQSG